MYLYDTWARFTDKARRTPLIWFGVLANVGILLIASIVMVGGTYGSVCVLRSLASSLSVYAPPSPRPALTAATDALTVPRARRLNIRDDYSANGGRPWSCADNSGST